MKRLEKKEKAVQLYSELGSLRKVGQKLGVSHETVRRWLKGQGKVSRSIWLRQIFEDMYKTVEQHYPDVFKLSIRGAYRWFKSHGFPGSWWLFRRLWEESSGEFL